MTGHKQSGSRQLNRHWQSGGGLSSDYGVQNSYDSNFNWSGSEWWYGRLPLAKDTGNGLATGYNNTFTLPIGGKITCKTTKGVSCPFENEFTLSVLSGAGTSRNNCIVYMQDEDGNPIMGIYGNLDGSNSNIVWHRVRTFMSTLSDVTDVTHTSITIPADTTEGVIHCESYFGSSSTKSNDTFLCEYDLTITTDSEGLQIEQSNLVVHNDTINMYSYDTASRPYIKSRTIKLFDGGKAYYAIDTSNETNSARQCEGFLSRAFSLQADNPSGYKSFYLANGVYICTIPAILYRDGKAVQK